MRRRLAPLVIALVLPAIGAGGEGEARDDGESRDEESSLSVLKGGARTGSAPPWPASRVAVDVGAGVPGSAAAAGATLNLPLPPVAAPGSHGGSQQPPPEAGAAAGGALASSLPSEIPPETLKGGTSRGPADPWPTSTQRPAGFEPLPQVAAIAPIGLPPSEPDPADCDLSVVSQPLVIGTESEFAKLGGLLKGAALGAASKAISSLLGGAAQLDSGGRRKRGEEPSTRSDSIRGRDKVKIEDPESGTRLKIGGKLDDDELLLSTRLDKADDKGTIHAIYLEQESCQRLWPYAYWAYELWHEWKLSVSWTRTTETYQDGKLVDRSVESGGFSDFGGGMLASGSGFVNLSDPEQLASLGRYQQALRDEMGAPAWQQLGFGAPTSGARSVGTPFKLPPTPSRRSTRASSARSCT
jgi:hypothetical protein